jgi:hypothetical protein
MLPSLIAAQDLGAKPYLLSLHSSDPKWLDTLRPCTACIVGKLSADTEQLTHSMAMANLAAITRLKNYGTKIILQYCDHHLSRSTKCTKRKLYRDLFFMADHIVYPTKTLQALTKDFIQKGSQQHIIYDPWQVTKQHNFRTLAGGETCRIIWFGAGKNLKYLLKQLKEIAESQDNTQSFELTILTRREFNEKLKQIIPTLKISASNWMIRFVNWSDAEQPRQLEHELHRSHITIIPSDPNDPQKTGASHNRLVDAARAGCLVLASPIESYLQLEKICMLGENIGELLRESVSNYGKISAEKNHACNEILAAFSPSNNNLEWKNLWLKVLAQDKI